jgi:protein-tyrosine kinase
MSIVEQALDKLQKSQVAARESVGGPIPATRKHAPQPDRESGVVVRSALPGPAPPAHHIKLDLDALRAKGLLPPQEEGRMLVDEYRRIKWPLLDGAFGRGADPRPAGNLIMITSALPAEGKTFTTFNLALNIAQERDSTVLLIDADVTKAHITECLGLSGQPGLLDALGDEGLELEQVVYGTQIEGLSFIPAGRRNRRAPELLASRRMLELLQHQAERAPNRIVLFDSSPLLVTNEAQVLARLAGQIVLVVRAEYTPQNAVAEAIALLDRSKSISCVLTHASDEPGREYYGAYGRYHDQPSSK